MVESADSTADSSEDPVKIGLWVRAFRVSWPTITESVVEFADSAVESADSTADSSEDPVKIGL